MRMTRGAVDAATEYGATSSVGLSIFMFSSFRVEKGGHPLSGLNGRAKHLLKLLAAKYRSSIPRDMLIEALWPESDPDTGGISLKVAAHNLRSALEPDRQNGHPGRWIIARNKSYLLNSDAGLWIDVEEFVHQWERGKRHEDNGELQEARAAYERAERLNTGDYLEEDVYEDWTVLRREELKDIYLELLTRLAGICFNERAYAEAVRYCHKIVLADPCREDAYRMLMRSHAALNQFARAGAWYAVCRTQLLREVDTQPSNETTTAFENLFSRVPSG